MASASKTSKSFRSHSTGAASGSRHLQRKGEAVVNGHVPSHNEGQFEKGAVVYLRLHNFLTFDDTEMYPGPNLNVIVGPNGTGKSSIVCAICLGLGGAPKLLGRAKDIKDFVKHNTSEGYVEIHLYDPKAKGKNPSIKRVMSATNNTSTYYINGRLAKKGEVTELVEKMNVQLGNHCQFLPQDMVVEFARMNKHQLLEETEKAIGPREMFESHEKLKGMKTTSADHEKTLREKKRQLDDEQRKNQLLERDVERFKNRQKYMSRIGYLKKKKLWVEYEAAREEWAKKKDARKKTAAVLKELQRKNQPLREKRQKEQERITVLKNKAHSSNQKVREIQNRIKSLQDRLQNLEEDVEEPKQELEEKKKEELSRKGKIENLKKEIESFENSLSELESLESLRRKVHDKNACLRDVAEQLAEVRTKQMDISSERQQFQDAIRVADDELRRMENVRNQRLDMLQKKDRQTFDAIHWLRENQHLFREPILEPIAVSVNIKDRRYEAQVEALLGGRDFFSFVAQNEEDRETFLREIRDKKQLKVNIGRVPNRSLAEFREEVIPFHELHRYGFKMMLIDLIEAPEPMLRYFCRYHNLHQIPIAEALSPEQIERVKRGLPKLSLFFTMSTRYIVKRSAYRDAASTRSSELMPARFLVASVNTQRKAELQRQIHEAQHSLESYNREYKQLEEQDSKLRREDQRLRHEKGELNKVIGSWKSIQSNINSRKTKLDSIQSQPPLDIEAAEKQCQEAIQEIQSKRVDCFRDLTSLVKSVATRTVESVEASLRVRTAEMSLTFLQQEYEKAKTEQEKAEVAFKQHEYDEKISKDRANALLNRARKECEVQNPSDNPRLIEMFNDLPNELERLDDMIHNFQAQAEMCMGTDENTVDEYEMREELIKKLIDDIEKIEEDLESWERNMARLKSEWLDPLKRLLDGVNERFRRFFSEHTQMNCAGEVALEENEDFAKYGILIRVKFREHEELQALNAQRQSGGERSVSTMLYLLALQETVSCPFRVVDEINQGMDPVNERHIFNLIVKSASRGAQYFLLTPKLLQNLEYSEAVQVHIVNNGQEMMGFDRWDVSKFLQ